MFEVIRIATHLALVWILPYLLVTGVIIFFIKERMQIAVGMGLALLVLLLFFWISTQHAADVYPEYCRFESETISCTDHSYENNQLEFIIYHGHNEPLQLQDATAILRHAGGNGACSRTQAHAGSHGDELNMPAVIEPSNPYHLDFTGCPQAPEEYVVDLTLVFEDRTVHGEYASWNRNSWFAIRNGLT